MVNPVLADEPTDNRGIVAADGVFDMIRMMNRERSMTFLIFTHDPQLAKRCGRIVEFVDEALVNDGVSPLIATG